MKACKETCFNQLSDFSAITLSRLVLVYFGFRFFDYVYLKK